MIPFPRVKWGRVQMGKSKTCSNCMINTMGKCHVLCKLVFGPDHRQIRWLMIKITVIDEKTSLHLQKF